MENHEKQLSQLKDNLDRARNLKYKAEARLEHLNKQQEELISELKDLGVNPDELDDEINKLEKEITNLFNKANQLLPMDILNAHSKE
ncbi:hypothetical protein GOQ27_15655 [Clostridium sp. D2Q-11]|uniref:Uncharacterized protein n=1 Tax=Anaeromonas frigoriresistens TaxID=2683708 RepID=A0A942V115_9FIRM|nr:hypothetical protein [Anaeromonas frigoriresistens]MBS4539911.1 hypothetical protein [Anaeromonas frigoriresistens]